MERGQKSLRLFDQYLGPLLLMLLKPFFIFRKKDLPKAAQVIGLIKMAAIGDTILISGLISDLKKWQPSARIVLFTGASNFEMAKLVEGVDLVEKLPLKNPWQALQKLRAQKMDLLIDTDSWPRLSALFAALSGARLTVGFKTSGQYRHFLFDRLVNHSNELHEMDNFRNLLREVEIPCGLPSQNFGHPWTSERTSNRILFHLWPGGTQSYLREWPESKWRDLALALIAKESCQIGLTGSPSEFEKNQKFMQSFPSQDQKYFENLAGRTLKDLLQSLQSCRLMVAVNTGIMHLAASLGTPTLGLHGPTNPKRWGPVGPRAQSLLSPTTGSGHLNLGFEYFDEINRTADLSVNEVLKACEKLLQESKS